MVVASIRECIHVLQLLQRCQQLKELSMSKLSLSAEAAAEVKKHAYHTVTR